MEFISNAGLGERKPGFVFQLGRLPTLKSLFLLVLRLTEGHFFSSVMCFSFAPKVYWLWWGQTLLFPSSYWSASLHSLPSLKYSPDIQLTCLWPPSSSSPLLISIPFSQYFLYCFPFPSSPSSLLSFSVHQPLLCFFFLFFVLVSLVKEKSVYDDGSGTINFHSN